MIRIDPTNSEPLFSQLAGSVRGLIASGQLKPGEKLPAARELAQSLEINVHTVLKAYAQLRDEGLLDLRRGRGAVISTAAGEKAVLRESIQHLVALARRHGISSSELAAEVERAFS